GDGDRERHHQPGTVSAAQDAAPGPRTREARAAACHPRLKEAAPRSGFFEAEQYAAVRRLLPADLQTACDVAYTFGWRMQSEVLALERRDVDLTGGRLSLRAGETKNEEGREVFLTPQLKAA